MVDVAGFRGYPAAGEGAMGVTGGHGAAQVRRDGRLGFAGVERKRDAEWQAWSATGTTGELRLAQPRGQPAGPGHHVGSQAEHRLPESVDRARR